MQKYVLVAFVNSIDIGFEYSSINWPLHVTLVANFAVLRNAEIDNDIAKIINNTNKITLTAEGDDYFGPHKDVKVTIIQPNEQLNLLHKELVDLLKSKSAAFDEPQYLKDGYRAHATVQLGNNFPKSEKFILTDVCLVDMFPEGDINKRKVLKKFSLK